MGSRRHAWVGCLLAGMLGIATGNAQTIAGDAQALAAQTIAPATEDALRAMSQRAGVIFAGKVIAIRRHLGIDGSTGVIEIEFAVDRAIRGVTGGTYTVREWGGLWAAGYEPFQVGERYLLLLHAPGASGLSSPVGGDDGAIPIRGGGTQAADPLADVAAGASAPADSSLVDLRWVAARAVRALSYRVEQEAHPVAHPVAVRAETASAQPVRLDVAGPLQSGSAAAAGAAYTTVIGMLRSWEKVDHAAR